MTIKARVPDYCRRTIREYEGRGGPPLYAPLPVEERCTRQKGHQGKCKTVYKKPVVVEPPLRMMGRKR